MIDVSHLHKRFGAVTAVEDVSFSAADGVVTGLLGPNGAGKTTTLRMLYTLIRPDRGTARVDGLDVAERPMDVRRAIGVLPDARGIYPRLTAREHARRGHLVARLGNPEVGELHRPIEREQHVVRGDIPVDQQERLAVHPEPVRIMEAARHLHPDVRHQHGGLVHGPRNVLLDEPTNGLDVMSTRAVRTIIRRLKAEGHCVLFSSHVMQEVTALCDRIVVVARGRVVAEGTPDELRARTGKDSLEEAFISAIGTDQGLMQ
ncbi:sodium ABC transporter ATP-binding protein [Stigmatella aurantiaca DW4/3-1]|uniref:Sodium ABC transporter ATP-binding protein n=1 Tax=Stigmatella aurantiaca (strain DW4/3-1) TaxID=378806 RepID=Q08UX1_STIAD|nr:sodium ABC transporter ATP-binding protein [Stigmatella aurantiaca DW4/3-1]